jgi:hypothetical protein
MVRWCTSSACVCACACVCLPLPASATHHPPRPRLQRQLRLRRERPRRARAGSCARGGCSRAITTRGAALEHSRRAGRGRAFSTAWRRLLNVCRIFDLPAPACACLRLPAPACADRPACACANASDTTNRPADAEPEWRWRMWGCDEWSEECGQPRCSKQVERGDDPCQWKCPCQASEGRTRCPHHSPVSTGSFCCNGSCCTGRCLLPRPSLQPPPSFAEHMLMLVGRRQ